MSSNLHFQLFSGHPYANVLKCENSICTKPNPCLFSHIQSYLVIKLLKICVLKGLKNQKYKEQEKTFKKRKTKQNKKEKSICVLDNKMTPPHMQSPSTICYSISICPSSFLPASDLISFKSPLFGPSLDLSHLYLERWRHPLLSFHWFALPKDTKDQHNGCVLDLIMLGFSFV
jgi:hypothetical protein